VRFHPDWIDGEFSSISGLTLANEPRKAYGGGLRTLPGHFLEVFRVLQVQQHSHGRAHKTAYSSVFPSITLLLDPEIDASKARKAIKKSNGRHWKKVLDGTPFPT
jgi:hypothetical protein